jgi:alpha-galactosidase
MTATRLLRWILIVVLTVFCTISSVNAQKADTLWLQRIDLSRVTQDWELPETKLPLKENSLTIGDQLFKYGMATRTEGLFKFDFKGDAQRFHAIVGLDDASDKNSSVLFSVSADDREVFRSPVMVHGSKAIKVDIDLKMVKHLSISIEDGGNGLFADRADFADAYISYKGTRPDIFNYNYINKRYILTPPESAGPRINGAKVFGVRPGNPFLYKIGATGKRPMTFSADNLPKGLLLDVKTGIITGLLKDKGESLVTLKATNSLGTTTRKLKIIAGDKIALTPPMGWNSFNCWADEVDQDNVKAAADAMVNSGLINHGWTYINIDDSWSVKPGSDDPKRMGEPRNGDGMINANKKFPDMKGMTGYIHSLGLKAGLYSSPGPFTCSKYVGSYQFEEKDALQWANWGFDYIKYDWCSYGDIANGGTIADFQKPYIVMRNALDRVNRDIVFSMCQYGMGKSWEWAEKIGGNCWRTDGDVIDTWDNMSTIGFNQAGKEKFAGPGHWNDPDMLAVGLVGWGSIQYPSRLTADEQYTHISMWSLLASPLLIGCDLTQMDAFTKNLLTNDEVIEINQDPFGKQAGRVSADGGLEIWVKELEDGSKAVGLFNRNSTAESIHATWNSLGLNGKQMIRDVWRQKDQGVFSETFSAVVPAHGVKLVTIRKIK